MDKRYDAIFEDCCLRTHCKPDKVVTWRPSGPWTIFVRCSDGSEYEYNGLDQTIHTLWQTDNENLTDDEVLVKFSYSLGRKMRAMGYDVASLSSDTGIGQSTIYRYLSGSVQPTYLSLRKICKVLHCSLNEFEYFL